MAFVLISAFIIVTSRVSACIVFFLFAAILWQDSGWRGRH
jgi:hypothetical protein